MNDSKKTHQVFLKKTDEELSSVTQRRLLEQDFAPYGVGTTAATSPE